MEYEQIRTILTFMQRYDSNGFWIEWLEEIRNEESSFDREYVLSTLQAWAEDSSDEIFKSMYDLISKL